MKFKFGSMWYIAQNSELSSDLSSYSDDGFDALKILFNNVLY